MGSNNSFSELLSLLAKLLLKANTLPTSTYRAKRLICPFSLVVGKIHACPNHCILYRKEHEFKVKCLVCGVSWYKRSYNHMYVDTMKKKNKTAISPESVWWQTWFQEGGQQGKSGACPICIDGTVSVYLPSSKKLVYMRHRWFLLRKHKYRKMKSHFDNTVKKDSALKHYTRKLVFENGEEYWSCIWKGNSKGTEEKETPIPTNIAFKKQSIFFKYFPY
jgi:hypothetical protein